VNDDAKLQERVEFVHRTIKSPAIVEQYIEGREIYVGVIGNDRPKTLPAWEFSMLGRNSDQPLIASDRAKWDPQYQRQLGLKTGPAKLSKKMADRLASLSKRIYRLLDMSGYARLDYRVTEDDRAYLLEANPNPQIARDEDFAESARHSHISYEELLQRILDVGLRYQPSRNLV
jgi:D-alanine-D-alanine ligase